MGLVNAKISLRNPRKPQLEPLEIKVYRALAEFPNAEIEPGVKTEAFLVNLLKEAYPKGFRAMLQAMTP